MHERLKTFDHGIIYLHTGKWNPLRMGNEIINIRYNGIFLNEGNNKLSCSFSYQYHKNNNEIEGEVSIREFEGDVHFQVVEFGEFSFAVTDFDSAKITIVPSHK
jgi:hypothetical protein